MRLLRAPSLNRSGQFVPMAAMVMFTVVVFLGAVVNVYKVARVKLKVQNLADAAALNVASQIASSINKVTDLNEWMNHFIEVSPNGPSKPGDVPDCVHVNASLPPLSCAENPNKNTSLNLFPAKGDAAAYARLVNTVNQSQMMFINVYNNFIGAGVGSSGSAASNSSLKSILLSDIPELADPGTLVTIWNSAGADPTSSNLPPPGGSSLNTSGIQPLKFKIHDITVSYRTTVPILNVPGPNESMSLGVLLKTGNQAAQPVGWMDLDSSASPLLSVTTARGPQLRLGVGVKVQRSVEVIGGLTIPVSAESVAFVVDGSGEMGDSKPDPFIANVERPVFKPTYWVKLVGAK